MPQVVCGALEFLGDFLFSTTAEVGEGARLNGAGSGEPAFRLHKSRHKISLCQAKGGLQGHWVKPPGRR